MLKNTVISYARVSVALLIAVLVANANPNISNFISQSGEGDLLRVFTLIALLFVLSFSVFYLSTGTGLPSFVIAIFFGMAAKPLLLPIVEQPVVLGVLVSLGATFILFGGGLETPFSNFKRLIWKILSLSFIGLFLTAITLSGVIYSAGQLFDSPISVVAAVLLGAILASTDPASIIPVLKNLRFRNRDTKDIVVSESAVTDVTGTLLTIIFLGLLGSGAVFTSVVAGYGSVFEGQAVIELLKQIIFGVLFGVIGYAMLEMLKHFKHRHEQEFESDVAYFFFVPIVIFVITISFGGSGYLAAFIAGLLFMLREQLHETEHFFNFTVDGFLKPVIFLLLGALVNFDQMFNYAAVGISAALLFMLVIRPITVFISLGPMTLLKKDLGIRELLFISWVRETGAIPAVLLITVISLGLPGMEGLVAVGMWVILLTLIIQPPLTPWIAKLLGVADDIADTEDVALPTGDKPFVVLGSRGGSFATRLPVVFEWATTHHVKDIVLLHCLEDNYSSGLVEKIGGEATAVFEELNETHKRAGGAPLHFWYVSRKGFLQDNINTIAKENKNVALIFVGRKLLDYKLSDIKELSVPMYFMD